MCWTPAATTRCSTCCCRTRSYASQYWVCVLVRGAETFETTVRPLLDEAYRLAVRKYENQAARREG